MTKPNEPMRMLAPTSFRQALSRRALFQIGGAAAGLAVIAAACGDDSSSPATTGGSGGTGGGSDLLSQYSNVVNKGSGQLAMFTWGDYNDPELIGALAESSLGVTMKVDYYPSNEDLITKLSAANGNSGFDIVVPTGAYIPQMVQKGLLQKFDLSKLPNMANVDPLYMGRDWDPGNEYSVCKDWGTTGWFYNKTVIKKELKTWNDFFDATAGEGSGRTSWLDTAPNVCGPYFWANGINWTTEKKEDLDAAEEFLVGMAKHVKAFDSYPSSALAEGAYDLSMAWNGDARQAYFRIADAGGNPDDWVWGLGAPATELWQDNYCIPTGAPNVESAHAWINWLLTPEISIKDLQYHGYHSGMKQIDKLIAELAPDLQRADMIFFSDDQVKTMQTGAVNSAQDRLVAILDKVKAAAAG
ncbi:MAG: spermidine/putrescine ABC transporter substrate-binding protein [Acidobacteria bacterium]|nr:spermidine/putrescine ABC transporter substrate-binding protein [Acidobacteriota bacterium]